MVYIHLLVFIITFICFSVRPGLQIRKAQTRLEIWLHRSFLFQPIINEETGIEQRTQTDEDPRL